MDTAPNGPGQCIGDDALAFGQTDGQGSAIDLNCTANDIDIATADVLGYSLTGVPGTFLPPPPGGIDCLPGQTIFVDTRAHLQNNAQERYDIGVWIQDSPNNTPVEMKDGGTTIISKAVTGSCTHYNLVVGEPGVADLDIKSGDTKGDACGDMEEGPDLAEIDLDVIRVTCEDPDGNGKAEVSACIGWQNVEDGPSRVCPDPGSNVTFRFGTTPNNKAKCNCNPLELGINIAASLDIEKQSIGGTAEFDYTVSGAPLVAFTRNTATQGNPTATSPVIINSANFGDKYVTETAEPGYTLTNISCTPNGAVIAIGTGQGGAFNEGATAGFDTGDNTVKVTIGSADTPSCTFTNTKQGSIRIVKDAVPNDAQDFSYTASGTGMTPSPFSLDDDADPGLSNQTTFSGLLPDGVRRVTEDTETGWTLTNIVCTGATSSTVVIGAAGAFNAGDTFVDVTLATGEDIVCTFTNTKQGSIKIVKDAVPNSPQDFSYTASGTGMTPSPFSLDDDADPGLSNEITFSALLPGGVRRVTEDTETGWTLTNIACTGATASTVVIGAAGGFNAGDTFVDVTIADGENIVCTFTNSQLGSIKIVKDAQPNAAQDFSYTATGAGMTPTPFSLDDDADPGLSNEILFSGLLANGARTVTEDTETGWTLTNIVCTGATTSTVTIGAAGGFNAGDNSVTIGLTAGENIVCTFTNTKQGSIRIVKDAVPNDAQDFSYTASGTGMTPSPFSLDDDADPGLSNQTTFSGLLPGGVRRVTEDTETGWTLTNIVCTGATASTVVIGAAGAFNAGDTFVDVTIADGEDIVCTFTNTKQGSIKIVKDASPNSPQDFSYTASGTGMTPSPFNLDDDADPGLSNEITFSGLLPNGVRRVTEDTETGWTLINIVCTGATSSTVTIGAAGGFNAGDTFVDVSLAAGENIVCTFTNSQLGSIKIVKDAQPNAAQDFSYTATGAGMTPSPFNLDDDADPGLSNEIIFSGLLTNGARTVTEDTETGWTLTNIVCTGAEASTVTIGAAGGFNPGDNSVTIGLAEGENIICTFTNTKQGSIKIVKDAVPNDAQDFSYTASGTGMTPSPFDLDDDADPGLSNQTTFSGLLPNGTRRVTEDTETGWTLTNIVCTGATASTVVIGAAGAFNAGDTFVDVTLANGEDIVCTFTNTKHGSITIVKETKNPETDPQDFSFTAAGTGMTGAPNPTLLDDDGETAVSPKQRTYSDLLPNGARTVTEGANAAWALTNIVCTGQVTSTVAYLGAGGGTNAFQAGDNQVSIGLAAGENITCTFTNERKARLIIEKSFPGSALVFDFSRTGISNFTLSDGQSNNSGFSLAPGNYTACELLLAVAFSATGQAGNTGGALSDIVLVNPDLPADLGNRCYTITLAYGDDKTIRITNHAPPGGDARTIGYWKNWSSCTGGNQYTKAQARGELDRTLDFYIDPPNPAVFPIGAITDLNCQQAVNLLDKRPITDGAKKAASDPVYNMVAQLFAAKLNYAAGAQQCPAATAAISQAQTLLLALTPPFDGTSSYKNISASLAAQFNALASTLDSYNNNTLACP